MKRVLLVFIAMIMAAVTLSSCGSDALNLTKSNVGGENWSVFVYLCGTDLESNSGMATENLQEMLNVKQPSNVKIIVQTGGTKTWQNDIVNADELGRYEIANKEMTLVDQQPLTSMGDANTLGDFLTWGVEKYPADKYMCLLWNHGGGSVSGAAFDELFDKDSLDLTELATGISKPGVQFEVIGFDTCLMATMENAAALSPYGRYLVASEEIEPGTGWDYTAWLQYICNHPTEDGLAVGKAICDSYYAKCQAGAVDEIATLSVTDLSQIPQLVGAFDNMAAELGDIVALPEKYQPFAKAMTKAENYGGNNDNEGYTNMVDLGDLVGLSGNALSKTGAEVLSCLDRAVKYKISGLGKQKSSGLSLFVPLSVDVDSLNKYATSAAVSANYLRYFESIFEWKMPEGIEILQPVVNNANISTDTIDPQDTPQTEQLNPEDFPVTFHTELDADGNYTLAFDSGENVIQSVAYNLYYEDDNGKTMMFLGSDYDLNYDDESGLYWDNFRNVWPIINGQTCSMLPLDFSEDYIHYTVPIKLNGKETNLRMVYDYKTNKYSVLGTWDGIDASGMSSKEIRKLVNGDKVLFMFNATDFDTEKSYTFEFGGFTVNGAVTVEDATLFDAVFYYEYEITDIFGRVYTTDLAKMVSKNGKITMEKIK